jgi:hypothetical protein
MGVSCSLNPYPQDIVTREGLGVHYIEERLARCPGHASEVFQRRLQRSIYARGGERGVMLVTAQADAGTHPVTRAKVFWFLGKPLMRTSPVMTPPVFLPASTSISVVLPALKNERKVKKTQQVGNDSCELVAWTKEKGCQCRPKAAIQFVGTCLETRSLSASVCAGGSLAQVVLCPVKSRPSTGHGRDNYTLSAGPGIGASRTYYAVNVAQNCNLPSLSFQSAACCCYKMRVARKGARLLRLPLRGRSARPAGKHPRYSSVGAAAPRGAPPPPYRPLLGRHPAVNRRGRARWGPAAAAAVCSAGCRCVGNNRLEAHFCVYDAGQSCASAQLASPK